MRRKPVFATRTIRNGAVRIYGKTFRCTRPAGHLEGQRMTFSLYWKPGGVLEEFACLHSFDGDHEGLRDAELQDNQGFLVYMYWDTPERFRARGTCEMCKGTGTVGFDRPVGTELHCPNCKIYEQDGEAALAAAGL